jgi:hypothetical protein
MLNFSSSLCPSLFIVYDWLFEEQGETTKNFQEWCVLFAFSVSTQVYETYEFLYSKRSINITIKGEAVPLQASAGPEGSRRLRLSDFKTIGT